MGALFSLLWPYSLWGGIFSPYGRGESFYGHGGPALQKELRAPMALEYVNYHGNRFEYEYEYEMDVMYVMERNLGLLCTC